MTLSCAPSNGYVQIAVVLRRELDLTPSNRGGGRMIDFSIGYRARKGSGGYASDQLATVTGRGSDHEIVSTMTAAALPNLAAGDRKPATFRLETAGHQLDMPFIPQAMVRPLEECDDHWYNRVLRFILGPFFMGR